MSVMKSTWRVECADSACPASEVPICPEAEGMAPTEHTSMKTSTPSVIFDLETGEREYTQRAAETTVYPTGMYTYAAFTTEECLSAIRVICCNHKRLWY